jgi:tetratricopeptide (TPR) repeat protein
MEIFRNHTGIMIDMARLSWSLFRSIFGNYLYQKAEKRFGPDKFKVLTQKALDKALQKEDNRIVWNELAEKGDLDITQLTTGGFDELCGTVSEENSDLCQTFLREMKENYLEQLCALGKKDPLIKYLMYKIPLLDDHEQRLRILEGIFPKIMEYFSVYDVFFQQRLQDTKQVIESEMRDISDFVGREEIIEEFPSGNVFIHGKAALGKTYLLLRLCELHNGYYIPLSKVREIAVLEWLVKEARTAGKSLFIDDFYLATPEVKAYIESCLWDVVVASRGDCDMDRTFHHIRLEFLEEEDIRAYFSLHGISIDAEVLELVGDDLGFPIKLRIFVEYLKRSGVSALTRGRFEEIMGELGLENHELPGELSEFYEKFVFRFLNRNQIELCYILSLLRFPGSVGQLSVISGIDEGGVRKLLNGMMGVLERYESGYGVFHESFREFCIADLGDTRKLNKKMGDYFRELVSGENGDEARIEAMYHYRNAEERSGFAQVFDFSTIDLLELAGLWSEARQNLEFGLNIWSNEETRGSLLLSLGIIQMRMGEWDEALTSYRKCEKIFDGVGDIHGMAETYNNMGLVYADKGKWDKALKYYGKSLEIKKKIGDTRGMAQTYANMGAVFYRECEWDKALKYYEKSLEIEEEIEDMHGMAQTYNNIGLVHADKGECEEALKYYEKSLGIKKEIGDTHGIAHTYANIGLVYAKKGKWDKALEYYEKSLTILEKFNDPMSIMTLYYNMADCYNALNRKSRAQRFHKKAENLRKKLKL